MKKSLALACLLIITVLVGTALAGSYTVTTTAAQDTKIGRMRTYANASGYPGAPFATDQAFVEARCKAQLGDDFRNTIDSQDDSAFETVWDAASVATKNSVCTTLGLAAGCKP